MNNNSDNIGYLLNKASRTLKWNLNRKLEEHNITSAQWAVLKDLHMNEAFGNIQNATPASIAERLNMDRPTMSGVITRLLKNEWIESMQNPEDRRSQLIKLTYKTREIIHNFEDIADLIITKAMSGFTEDETEDFKKYLLRIIDNLS